MTRIFSQQFQAKKSSLQKLVISKSFTTISHLCQNYERNFYQAPQGMKGLLCLFFTFLYFVLPSPVVPKSKQVVIHCCGGSGWGDYSASLFVAMKFREIGFRVYLVMDLLFQNHSSINKKIDDFFQIFEPAFSSLYKLTRADVFFYTTRSLNDDYESCWKRRLFSFNQLIEFLPLPSERPGLVCAPMCSYPKQIRDYYSDCPCAAFTEFHEKTFSLSRKMKPEHFAGIYIYNEEKLNSIADEADQSNEFIQLVNSFSSNKIFYFSYFGSDMAEFGKVDAHTISVTARYLEYLTLIARINEGNNRPILVALQNPGISISQHLFKDPASFDLITGKWKTPLKVISLGEFRKMLNPIFAPFLVVNDLSNISVFFYNFISNPTFLWAIKMSADFVGCTGDDSFSKVLSMGKVPLYYALDHKIELKISFVSFVKACGLENLYQIFDNFIDVEGADIEKQFIDVLNEVSLTDLQNEIEIFKRNTIGIIKTNYSIFDKIYSALYKRTDDEFVEVDAVVFDNAQKTLALKRCKKFQLGSFENLTEIFCIYFSSHLYPKSLDFTNEFNRISIDNDGKLKLYDLDSATDTTAVMKTFFNFAIKQNNLNINSVTPNLLINNANIALFNSRFKGNSGCQITGDTIPLEPESVGNFMKSIPKWSAKAVSPSKEPTVYNMCCNILFHLRVSNSTALNELDPLLNQCIDDNHLKNTCRNVIEELANLKYQQKESPLFVTFEQLAQYVNSFLPESQKFHLPNLLKERSKKLPSPLLLAGIVSQDGINEKLKVLFSVLSTRLQDLSFDGIKFKLIDQCQMIYNNLLRAYRIKQWIIALEEQELNALLKDFIYNKRAAIFKEQIRRILVENSSVLIGGGSLSFDEMIALINEIKGTFDEEEEDAEQFATKVTARFLQQAKY